MVERIVVPFEGPGAGIGPLAWGQRQVWAAMVESGSSMSMGGVVPATDGRTVQDYAGELRFFMCRYAAMRTLLRFAADGTVTQEVFGAGETVLEVHDTTGGDDPAAVAEALARSGGTQVRRRAEWPLRMGVVRRDGTVTHVVALMCHIAADLGGVEVMMRDLAGRARSPVARPRRRRPWTWPGPAVAVDGRGTRRRRCAIGSAACGPSRSPVRPARRPRGPRGDPTFCPDFVGVPRPVPGLGLVRPGSAPTRRGCCSPRSRSAWTGLCPAAARSWRWDHRQPVPGRAA